MHGVCRPKAGHGSTSAVRSLSRRSPPGAHADAAMTRVPGEPPKTVPLDERGGDQPLFGTAPRLEKSPFSSQPELDAADGQRVRLEPHENQPRKVGEGQLLRVEVEGPAQLGERGLERTVALVDLR